MVLQLSKDAFPTSESLPKAYYRVKTLLRNLQAKSEREIDENLQAMRAKMLHFMPQVCDPSMMEMFMGAMGGTGGTTSMGGIGGIEGTIGMGGMWEELEALQAWKVLKECEELEAPRAWEVSKECEELEAPWTL